MNRSCQLRKTERPAPCWAFSTARLTVVFLALSGHAHANDNDQFLSSHLTDFLELCVSSEPTGEKGFLEGAAEFGFSITDAIDDEVQGFFQTRELSLLSHANEIDSVASIFTDRTDSFLTTSDDTVPTFIKHENGWVGLVNSPTVAFLANGVPHGETHLCSFLGYGWLDEPSVRSALARVMGSDFPGGAPGVLNEGTRYLLTGHGATGYPYAQFFVTAVMGVPEQHEPTIELSISVIRHTSPVDEAFQANQ